MAMKKEIRGNEGIMLSHILKMYDKESLVSFARELQVKGRSGLKKDDLAEKIAAELLEPSIMRKRFATFTKEQRALFERAIKAPFVPVYEEMENALILHENVYAFMNKQDELNVPEDVASAYETLNTPEFQQYAEKMSWLAQCLFFGESIYGVFNMDVLLKLYNTRKNLRISREELEQLCDEFPDDMAQCCVESEGKYILAEYLTYDEQYKDLLEIQADKEFYIPTAEQIVDYHKNMYLSEEPAYRKLREFLQKEIGLSCEDADGETADVWERIEFGMDFQDILQRMTDVCGEALDEHRLGMLVGLLQDANNHTRLQIHRGHTPNEMMKRTNPKGTSAQKPVMVAGSTAAADMLRCASAELEAMGVKLDLSSNAVSRKVGESVKKIYPNDPCPCGSGKKYKKCCGR